MVKRRVLRRSARGASGAAGGGGGWRMRLKNSTGLGGGVTLGRPATQSAGNAQI
jgi:hypothetical protein